MKIDIAIDLAERKKSSSNRVTISRAACVEDTRFEYVEVTQGVPENITLIDLTADDWRVDVAAD